MPAFEYQALKPNGKKEHGVLEADTERQIRQQLRERGLAPLEVNPVLKKTEKHERRSGFVINRGISAGDLSLLTRQIATLVRSGSPLADVLATTSQQTEKPRIKSIILAVRSRIVEGHSLADSLAEFPSVFPSLYRATVSAGEQSGHLDAVLERLADYTESRQALSQQVSMALFYPAILILMAIMVLAVLMGYVVPQVVQVFENTGQELPILTRILIMLSDWVRAYGIFAFIGFVIAVIAFLRALKKEAFRQRFDRQVLRLPLIGKLARGLNAARFSRTLSILAGSGVPILQAMDIASQVIPNIPMRKAVEVATERVREGSTISSALQKSTLFPPMTVHLIASGESSGKLEEMLERSAEHQEKETSATISMVLNLFEPILIVVMGGIVLTIVIAILLPIFELNTLVK
jgi:general secretion pathway protein F